eukprot:NODE_453_length_8264_cov_0.316105.p1 type:complete len:350 gc:universal NODE_453_length_8264_cov_0.316105:2759-3808(+)
MSILNRRYSTELIGQKNRLILRQGKTNRSLISGHVATVFGCSGFIGKYLVNRLGQQGTQVITPYRGDSERVRHLKVMGDLGQIVQMQFDPKNIQTYEDAISASDTVYNLIGRNYDTKNFTMVDAQVEPSKIIADLCAKYGTRLFQISHIAANPEAKSVYLQSKYDAEQVVKRIYPDATIVRLSSVFGHEDRFIRRFNWLTLNKITPLPNHGSTVYYPVNVSDVATGLVNLMGSEGVEGGFFELYGPRALSFSKCLNLFNQTTYRNPYIVNTPQSVFKLFAEFVELLPFPWISIDEVKRLYVDEAPINSNSLDKLVDGPLKDYELSLVEFARRYRFHNEYGNSAPEHINK